MDEHGGKVADEIPDPPPPSPNRPTPPSPPNHPAKKEERADLPFSLELKAFRVQVEERKQTRRQARVLVERFFAEEFLVPRKKLCGRLGGWPGRKKREEEGRERD